MGERGDEWPHDPGVVVDLTDPQFLVITRVLRPLGRHFLPSIPAPVAAIGHAGSFHHPLQSRHEAGTTRKAQDIPGMQTSVKNASRPNEERRRLFRICRETRRNPLGDHISHTPLHTRGDQRRNFPAKVRLIAP